MEADDIRIESYRTENDFENSKDLDFTSIRGMEDKGVHGINSAQIDESPERNAPMRMSFVDRKPKYNDETLNPDDNRRILISISDDASGGPAANALPKDVGKYPTNRISSTKYNLITFLPVTIFH